MAMTYREPATPSAGQLLYTKFASFPMVCFTLTLLTDIAYWQSANLMWQNFSAWLLLSGLVVAAFAALAGLVILISSSRLRALPMIWFYAIGNVIVLLVAIANSLVHARDGWTAIVPLGLTLSAITVVLMLITGWMGTRIVHQYRIEEVHHV
ncbi:MAG: DUF2231 domain-containing protein [Sulfitobacter sp.]